VQDAAGHCLSVSLDFALAARQFYGFDTRLIRWSVIDDRNYADHWAVLLDDEWVLDMTHVQVDGNTALMARIDSYPCNFRNARIYPCDLLTGAYVESQAQDAERFTSRFLWYCGSRLFRHDMHAALHARDVQGVQVALRQGAQFLVLFAIGSVQRWLAGRARRLMGRLDEQQRRARRLGHEGRTPGKFGTTVLG